MQDGAVKGYFAANPTSTLVLGAATGDIVVRAENKSIFFSANEGGSPHFVLKPTGNVGVGTANPATLLDVGQWFHRPGDIVGDKASVTGDLFVGNDNGDPLVSGVARFRLSSNTLQGFLQWNLYYNGAGLKLLDTTGSKPGYDVSMNSHSSQDGIYFNKYENGGGGVAVPTALLTLHRNGNVGMGLGFSEVPTAKLDVRGNAYVAGPVGIGVTPSGSYALSVTGNAHFNGTVTGTNIKAKYQDVAEWVPATEDLAPATVVVLAKGLTNTVTQSRRAYDASVAGVVSAEPGIILGDEGAGKVQVATTGRVKVRVDASRGPIDVGDLLVTSDIPGTAMRSEPITVQGRSFHQPGTLIGKALEPLRAGTGEILVLLSLQ
jgi:hypothetical protein